ncbi:50S ribosomal protein L10 [Candidatus Babeliales bacterium]|nr:50S ribosomal protein L10 [Candidatus Babeliales bacterium]MCF7899341.1 50S ribosomal protein L10 [Candidatus Babeliales bacterium]
MNRQQKEAVVKDVRKLFSDSHATFLIGYKGLDVSKVQSLRKDLREDGGLFKVTKARLMKIAAKDTDSSIENFCDQFKGQVGLVFAQKEVPSVAKKLVNFSKENELLEIISGFFDSKVLSKSDVNYLASLPSKEVLLAQFLATMQAPTRNLAFLLNLMVIRLLYTLKQISEKEQK